MPGDALHALERHLESKHVIVYVGAFPQVSAGDALPESEGRVYSQKPCRAQHVLVGLLRERHAVPVPHGNDSQGEPEMSPRSPSELLKVFPVQTTSNGLALPPAGLVCKLIEPTSQVVRAAANATAWSKLHLRHLAPVWQLQPNR